MLRLWTSIEETSGDKAIKDEGREEGRKEGRDKGRAEGQIKAKVDALNRVLTRRFGSLPGWAAARIAAADIAQPDAWIDGILDGRDLTDPLGPADEDEPACHEP